MKASMTREYVHVIFSVKLAASYLPCTFDMVFMCFSDEYFSNYLLIVILQLTSYSFTLSFSPHKMLLMILDLILDL